MIEILREGRRAIAATLVLSLGTVGASGCAEGVNTTERTVTVCGKDIVRVGSGDTESNEFRVFASDEDGHSHAYKLVDTLFIGGTRFDSAEAYGSLTEGRTYEIKSSGARIPVLGQYPNIIDMQRVDPDHPEWC